MHVFCCNLLLDFFFHLCVLEGTDILHLHSCVLWEGLREGTSHSGLHTLLLERATESLAVHNESWKYIWNQIQQLTKNCKESKLPLFAFLRPALLIVAVSEQIKSSSASSPCCSIAWRAKVSSSASLLNFAATGSREQTISCYSKDLLWDNLVIPSLRMLDLPK